MTDFLASRPPGFRARNLGRRFGVEAVLDAYELEVEDARREDQRYQTLAFFGVATWCPRTVVGRGERHLGLTDEQLLVGGYHPASPRKFEWWRDQPWQEVTLGGSEVRDWWYATAGADRFTLRRRDAEMLVWWLRARWDPPDAEGEQGA